MKTYMIEATPVSGRARWFSDEIDEDRLQEELEKYESMVEFFGGGMVQTWELIDGQLV